VTLPPRIMLSGLQHTYPYSSGHDRPPAAAADSDSDSSSLCSSGTGCSTDSLGSDFAEPANGDIYGTKLHPKGSTRRQRRQQRQQWQRRQQQLESDSEEDFEVLGARQRVGGAVYGHNPTAKWEQLQQQQHKQQQQQQQRRVGASVLERSSTRLRAKPLRPQLVQPLQASGFRYRPTRSPFKHKRVMMQQVGGDGGGVRGVWGGVRKGLERKRSSGVRVCWGEGLFETG
jgi:hypothetical protein